MHNGFKAVKSSQKKGSSNFTKRYVLRDSVKSRKQLIKAKVINNLSKSNKRRKKDNDASINKENCRGGNTVQLTNLSTSSKAKRKSLNRPSSKKIKKAVFLKKIDFKTIVTGTKKQ